MAISPWTQYRAARLLLTLPLSFRPSFHAGLSTDVPTVIDVTTFFPFLSVSQKLLTVPDIDEPLERRDAVAGGLTYHWLRVLRFLASSLAPLTTFPLPLQQPPLPSIQSAISSAEVIFFSTSTKLAALAAPGSTPMSSSRQPFQIDLLLLKAAEARTAFQLQASSTSSTKVTSFFLV